MNIVFCADYGVLHALHVAAYSVLNRMDQSGEATHFFIISDKFEQRDIDKLAETLRKTGKKFQVELVRLDPKVFAGFKPLNGSLAAYYKLVIPELIKVDRYLYLDTDILCDVDLSPLEEVSMEGVSVAWVSEAPMDKAFDRKVALDLGNNPDHLYFNSGVLLVNALEWKKQDVTAKTLEYLTHNEALIREQSALNVVLHQRTIPIDEKYNSLSNMRKHWPDLIKPLGQIDRLIHFADYPKPWDFLGELMHPQFSLWREILNQTAMPDFHSWDPLPSRRIPKTKVSLLGYKKGFKDKILFTLYSKGLFKRVKGV
jgi:lipopolysaccharide biosynthesis glycosyltransferase